MVRQKTQLQRVQHHPGDLPGPLRGKSQTGRGRLQDARHASAHRGSSVLHINLQPEPTVRGNGAHSNREPPPQQQGG